MAGRQSTGKRLRFEVFKRDHFTCQYCGAQPPDVVLVADHVDPVAAGGSTTMDNLLTACEPCNQGKAHRPLSAIGMRPDADLLYLATQQEIAEMRRYQGSLQEKERAIKEVAETLREMWFGITYLDWAPCESDLHALLMRYSPEVVGDAVSIVAHRIADGKLPTYGEQWLRYLHGVARNLSDQRDEG